MRTRLLALMLLLCIASPCWAQQGAPASGADLALRLLGRMEAEQNAALSPVSLQTAFAMVAAGTRGPTRDELVKGLALGDNFLEASKAFLASLAQDGAEVMIANRLWPGSNFSVKSDYLSLCKDTFGAAPETLNYADTEKARKSINRWVGECTKQKIPELLKPGDIDASTVLVLTNALYFKGEWKDRFDKSQTRSGTFHGPNGPVSAAMMTQIAHHTFYDDPQFYAVGLDYKDSKMCMTLLVPKKLDGWKTLRETLSPELLKSLHKNTEESKVELTIPRFQARSRLEVIPSLRSLGVKKAFGQGDFSGITSGAMTIGQAVHEAVVEVNEEGTVAAAATAVVTTRSASHPKQVVADRPFLFTISDSTTGAILFIGQVVEPEKG